MLSKHSLVTELPPLLQQISPFSRKTSTNLVKFGHYARSLPKSFHKLDCFDILQSYWAINES